MFMRMVYDDRLAQAAYLFGCQRTGDAIIIDPERDIDRYIELAAANGLRIVAVAETHIHADFLSGAREFAELGATVYVSDEGDADWKYGWIDKTSADGEPYRAVRLHDGDTFMLGAIEFRVMHTPGHTPEHIAFVVTDRGSGADEPIGIVSGDFVFVGDLGRPDLLESAAGQAGAMEPSARQLFQTVGRLGDLPEFVQVWPAHGAGSACGKALGAVPSSTIGYERRFNPAIRAAGSEQQFVDFILAGQPEPPMYFANMKRDNKAGPKVLGGLPHPAAMSPDDVRALDTSRVALIDTRTWKAFRTGHVPGSLYIPLGGAFNSDAGSLACETDDIYLIAEPHQVESAVRSLVRIGFDNVRGWFDANAMPALADTFVSTPEVNVAEAARLLDTNEARVLDVRRATEFADGHMPNAVNIAHTRLAGRLDEVPREMPLIVNCRSGGRSGRACAYLERLGFDVMNLEGGMLAWERAAVAIERPV